MKHYLWHVEFTLEPESEVWSSKDFVASPEFDDACNVAKIFLKSEEGTGKNSLDLFITKLERGITIDCLEEA